MEKGKEPRKQAKALHRSLAGSVRALARLRPKKAPAGTLAEQPFDDLLLARSRIYRRSRELFRKMGGTIDPVFISSPRTLSSPTLLEPQIQYSPVQSEMIWSATDAQERKNPEHLLKLRTYVGSLFHEQNHRVLWTLLPPAPKTREGIRRYLNFAESLVISADMALGDELGPKLAQKLYLTGTIYDPGTDVRALKPTRREYRNYLQATVHATYLNLEFYDPKDIERGIAALFPGNRNLAVRAAVRCGTLDRAFVWKTNPIWQRKHGGKVVKRLSTLAGRSPLLLPSDPMDHRQQYLLAEKWFEALGL